jgi:hypothetical protein
MHVLFVCSGSLDFVCYISLVSSMIAGMDGGEGSKCGSMERIYFSGSSTCIV